MPDDDVVDMTPGLEAGGFYDFCMEKTLHYFFGDWVVFGAQFGFRELGCGP